MKIYIVRYYDEMADGFEIDKVFSSKELASQYCEKQNEEYPNLQLHWIEREVE